MKCPKCKKEVELIMTFSGIPIAICNKCNREYYLRIGKKRN
jgi:hypothetical protein